MIKYLALTALLSANAVIAASCDDVYTGYQCHTSISHNWGQYSPYFSVPTEIPDEIPDQCSVTFVQHLQRHGARYPTSSKTTSYKAMMKQVLTNAGNFSGPYSFLNNFTYTMGSDDLTFFGTQQLVNAGTTFYKRYQELSNDLHLFVRASGEQRVVDSASNFTLGFHNAKLAANQNASSDSYPYNIVVISEDDGYNNTLDASTCIEFEDGYDSTIGDSSQAAFASNFIIPIRNRLNNDMPGANLTATQVVYFMDMCPFETVSSDRGVISDFCALFTEAEWQSYNYYQTLGKFYGHGWGNPLGAAQGVGFVNELIARMTGMAVQDHTATNSTLDSSMDTFPVGGNNCLFADFSHDDPMTSIFSALGLYNQTGMLSNTSIVAATEAHGYAAAWTVPFAGHAYIEKQECSTKCGRSELVRIIVNDRVIPLQNCGADSLGRCRLHAFIESLSFARKGGNWDQCFV